jgi:hypothetical protein
MPRAKGVSSVDLSLHVSMQNAKNAFRGMMSYVLCAVGVVEVVGNC